MKLVPICLFAAAILAGVTIDSSAGSIGCGRMTRQAAIGSAFAPGDYSLGVKANESGLADFVEMRYLLSFKPPFTYDVTADAATVFTGLEISSDGRTTHILR